MLSSLIARFARNARGSWRGSPAGTGTSLLVSNEHQHLDQQRNPHLDRHQHWHRRANRNRHRNPRRASTASPAALSYAHDLCKGHI